MIKDNFDSFRSDNLIVGIDKPTPVKEEVVEVEVSVDAMVRNYGKAFVNEAYRVNPKLADRVALTEDEMVQYCDYLLTKRIQCVEQNCPDFYKLKALYIPAYVQYAISMVGEVRIGDLGLKLVPRDAKKSEMTFEQALEVSNKIGMFQNDLQIVRDAMPRSIEGDVDVMSTALIAGYVRSIRKVEHVASTYVTAFLNMTLRQEVAFKALYRVEYDDVDFIVNTLTTTKDIF